MTALGRLGGGGDRNLLPDCSFGLSLLVLTNRVETTCFCHRQALASQISLSAVTLCLALQVRLTVVTICRMRLSWNRSLRFVLKKNYFSSRINFNAFAFCKIIENFCCFNFIKSSNQTLVLHWICNSDVRDLDVRDGFIVPANHEHVGLLYIWKICVFCVSQFERRRSDSKSSDLISLHTDFVFYRFASLLLPVDGPG